MEIMLNGICKTIDPDTLVFSLVEAITGQPDPQGVAVALNGAVLHRKHWTTTQVNDGDRIEIVHAMAGG